MRIKLDPPEYMPRKAVANYLRKQGLPCSETTLAIYACTGEGPPFYKYRGRRILYRKNEVDAWRDRQLRRVGAE